MAKPTAPVIIADGGLNSLVALACASDEAVTLGSSRASGACAHVWVPPVFGPTERERAHAVERQIALYNARRIARSPIDDPLRPFHTDAESGQARTQILFAALSHARDHRLSRVIWPLHPGLASDEDGVNLEFAGSIIDRALLVEQLARIDAPAEPLATSIETPHADLTDRQLVEIAQDLSLPVRTLWWWGGSSDEAMRERERYEPLMQVTGLMDQAERRVKMAR